MTDQYKFLMMLRLEHGQKFITLTDQEILTLYEHQWGVWFKKLGWELFEDSFDMREHFANWASLSPIQRVMNDRNY